MNVLVIDDEKPARDLVKKYLDGGKEIFFLQEATNGFEGIKLINSQKPDVVLLDIQMPKLNGFEMLELIENPPSVIFCSAYDEFAIKAFEQNAIDYLLKPFSKDRLLEALAKVKLESKSNYSLVQDSISLGLPLERIVVKNSKSIEIIPVDEIQYLMSQDDYVEINVNGKKHLKQQRLKYYESSLNNSIFVRVHRQYILNVKHIVKLDKFGKESYIAQLKSGDSVSISATGYLKLKEVLDM
jgi:two-component system, LytTR family, response regulator